MAWESGEVTILLPDGDVKEVPGFIHEGVAIAEHECQWLVLHRWTGLILGSFDNNDLAADLEARLTRYTGPSLNRKRLLKSWDAGLWGRLDEIRAEHARENGLPPPPPLYHPHLS